MPDYSPSQLSPKLRQQIANNPSQEFAMVMNDMREAANSQHRNFSNSKISAEVISGFRTGESTGEGTDTTDARQIKVDGEVYLEILVYTDSGKSKTIGHPADPSLTPAQREIVLSCLEWARSDAPLGSISTPPNCGDRVTCYYENGAVQNSDFSGLRFRTDSITKQNSSSLMMESGGSSPMSNLFTGQVTPLGATQSPAAIQALTAADIATDAIKYDQDSTIPRKTNHAPHLGDIHPEFLPYVKAWIFRCWNDKKIEIQLNDGYRSPKRSNELYAAWVAGGKNGVAPAKGGSSYHNAGLAIDFNPVVNGTKLMSYSPKANYVSSGLVAIGEAVGLRWGGHFGAEGTPAYDAIHFDFGNNVTKSRRAEMIAEATAQNVEVTSIPTGRT